MDEPARGWVVVAEDDQAIAELIRLYLSRDGFGVHLVRDGRDALRAVRTHRPVALVLDIGLPGMDGVEVCRTLRGEDDWTPVLFVTARDDEVDRVLGLELGADDYITKPFSPRELVARVRTVLRRAAGPARAAVQLGAVSLDRETRRVRVCDRPVDLTPTEFDLLAHLVAHPDRVFTREELLSTVWGYAAAAGTRTVDVHVAQLRSKLGEDAPIRTVRGVGYAGWAGRS
ncbi:response regulator transcription factor [Actinotalea sp. M2MS4P-6]|uniref:response regulator transcription factor n=1 Tax=Actinotalea sp. M2MS4P-6 TaxID=2983762 RepID=UPI0021E3D1B0|nr:response regulator transcription factor [Actinotalea sp. M2MS4P-6]MCV2393499.1 response regulator transcription factor [Actinotalea sp. M2MS4P-6]